MEEMASGAVVREFTPRKGDLMRELFAAFNLLIRACNARAKAEKGRAECAKHDAGTEVVCAARDDDTTAILPSARV